MATRCLGGSKLILVKVAGHLYDQFNRETVAAIKFACLRTRMRSARIARSGRYLTWRGDISGERRTVLIDKKRAALAAAALLGAALINPAHGSGIHSARSCKAAHVPASCNFRGASTQGPELLARWQYVGLPFFPYRRLVTPYDGVGVFYESHLSCWTWVPADLGWQRVWECKWPLR